MLKVHIKYWRESVCCLKLGVFFHLKQGIDSIHELKATANNTAIVAELLRYGHLSPHEE
jgi:hypothetical protein